MEVTAILAFLKSNWKWIAVGLAIAGLTSYIEVIKLERNHYKSEYQEVQLKLDTLKEKDNQLQADNEAITGKYRDTLKTANTLVTENARINGENIAKDKELVGLKLSLNAIRLFNASKQSTSEPTPTISGNDGTTASVAKALEEKSQTLADLLQVVNINDANHIKCIKTVKDWQNFWIDYSTVVEASNAK